MKTLKILVTLLFLSAFLSCQVGPQPIEYGLDGCYFCKMTIVDKVHAAEVVTQKGKVYKFDAIECMIHFSTEFDTSQIKLYLSNDFMNPNTLIDATRATFLISENIPSPMGAYLSAFSTRVEAEKMQNAEGGELYDWNSLLAHLNQ